MKTIKNIIKLLKSNKIMVMIFSIQLFFVLFFTVTTINEYRESVKIYNKGVNSKLNNAIFYMGKVPYSVIKNDKEINNSDETAKAKQLLEKFYQENIKFFDGRLLESKYYGSITDENGKESGITLFDRITMDIVINTNGVFNREYSADSIPVLVNNKYKKDYEISDKIKVKSFDGSNLTLDIIGYYEEDKSFNINLNGISNSVFRLSEILTGMKDLPENKFVALQEGDYLKNISANYTFGEPSTMILYVKEEYFDEVAEKLENFSKKNDIGYYFLIKDSIDKEKDFIYINRQKYLDFSIALYCILILSVIAIGYISSKMLKRRYKIYRLNGASSSNLYITTFLYYLFQFYFPILIYTIFIQFAKSDFSKYYLSKSSVLTMISHGSFEIDMVVFCVLTIAILGINLFISYLPLREINKGGNK